MKLIIAGNVRQFRNYCDEQKISTKEAKYITSPEMLYGYVNPEIVFYGTFWNNPACQVAKELVRCGLAS